ncbi:MAG: hypothetical protein ABFC63_00455 [Thermoguttaceae bacterium]
MSVPAGAESDAVVRCPLCAAEYPLSESLALAPPELILVAAHAAEPTAIADAPGEAKGGEALDAAGDNEAAAMAQSLPRLPAASRLRSRREKSALQKLIEVVVGGVAGILVAYYGLALYFRADFYDRLPLPRLPLPFMSWLTAPPAPPPAGPNKEKSGARKPSGSAKRRTPGCNQAAMPLGRGKLSSLPPRHAQLSESG